MWQFRSVARELNAFALFLVGAAAWLAIILTMLAAFWIATGGSLASLLAAASAFSAQQRLQFVGTIFVVATLLIAWRNLRHTQRIAILNKRADVIQHCANRYDDLYRERSEISTEKAARYWYNRMWGLKSDQLDFFLAGWVDLDTLRSWIYSTYALVSREEPFALGDVTLQQSWEAASSYHRDVNPMFYEMTNLMFRAWDDRRDATIGAPLCDAILIQLDRESEGEREMVQRRYNIREYLSKLKKIAVFDLNKAFEYVDKHKESYGPPTSR